MPSRFSSRKNFLVPSTCCSNVGFGSLSKSAMIVFCPPLTDPSAAVVTFNALMASGVSITQP